MSEENIRTVKINGGADEEVADIVDPVIKNRRRTYKRRQMKGGDGEEEAQALPTNVPIINVTKDNTTPVIPQKGGSSASVSPTPSKSNIPPPPQLQTGAGTGTGATKVILKPKNRTSKVILKKKTTATTPAPVPVAPNSGLHGKKKTQKLVVKQVSKRLKKTRHVVKHAKEMPLDALRKILVAKKLIKPNSKAPESILRQIYADSVIVGKKTL